MPPRHKNPHATRKHVTTACLPCRESKVKCDGVLPTCKNCRARARDCRYPQGEDRRRIPLRTVVDLLAARVDQLSQALVDHHLAVPAMNEPDRRAVQTVFEALDIRCQGISSPGLPHTPSSTPGQEQRKSISPIVHRASSAMIPGLTTRNPLVRGEEEGEGEGEGEDDDDEVTSLLSCRLGKLQLTHDGQLRYFGSTSNLTLLDALVSTALPAACTPVAKDAREVLENAKLDQEVDVAFEKHLIRLYFAWQDPCFHVVDEESFWRSRSEYMDGGVESAYLSGALTNAMCALGAAYEPRYHPGFVTFPRSLAEFFADRARALIEVELESPSLATIQALVILSSHEAACTRDTRGWLYSGMAMRLAFDLGLHLDMASYVQKGIISSKDADVRSMVFWGTYINEHFWGFYLGCSCQSPNDGAWVSKPKESASRSLRWRPPGWESEESLSNPVNAICRQVVALYHLMLPLTDVLYGCSDISKHALQELCASTVDRLGAWKKNLPEDFRVEETALFPDRCYLPHVLTLHMQYYQFMIHCHRPYISKHYIQPQAPPQGPGSPHARQTCLESALAIVRLLHLHEQHYSFRQANLQLVSFIFSAALILIFAARPELVMNLSTCFRALDEMATCFESAKRTSAFLNALRHEWQLRRRGGPGPGEATGGPRGTKRGAQTYRQSAGAEQDVAPKRGRQETDRGPGDVDRRVPGVADVPVSPGPDGGSPSLVEFMDPDLCNILLSEGIPRAFI